MRKRALRSVEILSHSPAETRRLGERIGRGLGPGSVVSLAGELGTGKTTLAKGIARGLGVDSSRVTSPTFTLINEYPGRLRVYHMDWYRLASLRGTDRELVSECFAAGGVALVEWPEHGRGALPADRLSVELRHVGPRSRRVRLRASGPTHQALLETLRNTHA